MLAIRDQENLVNTHQTAAAAKPLNQGLKQLAPKTPGRQVPLRDENNPIAFGKNTVKGNGTRQENGKPGKMPPVTPMEPRNRAPLGVKTNNQKARAPQTPAPFGGTLKPGNTNRRASTIRKKTGPVSQQPQTKVFVEAAQDDVPDIEYMPPKPTDLPDLPDDVTYDTTFPQFRPKNRALGLESVYGKQQVGRDGLTQKQRKFREDSLKCDKMAEEMIMKQLDNISFNEPSEDESIRAPAPQPRATRSGASSSASSRHTRTVSTLRSREAAAALAAPTPSAAAPRVSAAPKSRLPSSLMPRKKTRVPTNPSSMRNTAAAVTSNSTLGYSKGRSVSSTLHDGKLDSKPSDTHTTLSPESYMQIYGPPPLGSEMWIRCKAAGCFDSQEETSTAQELEENLPTFEEDEEALNFQLAL